jgi:hypothetical protein
VTPALPGAHEMPAGPPRPPSPSPQSAAPEPQKEEPADYASRLLQAKKRVWEERERDPRGD